MTEPSEYFYLNDKYMFTYLYIIKQAQIDDYAVSPDFSPFYHLLSYIKKESTERIFTTYTDNRVYYTMTLKNGKEVEYDYTKLFTMNCVISAELNFISIHDCDCSWLVKDSEYVVDNTLRTDEQFDEYFVRLPNKLSHEELCNKIFVSHMITVTSKVL